MLNIELDKESGIAILRPESALSEDDFLKAAAVIDPVIEEAGKINGLVICTESFPGWDTFGGMMEHFRFVRDHHKKIEKVAIVTDSKLGDFAERVASHFISAQIKHFVYSDLDGAKNWIQGEGASGG